MKKQNRTKEAKDRRYQRVKEWRKNTKQKLFEGFGECCGECGVKDHPTIYDFHHVNPDEKEFSFSGKIASWETLLKEVEKCVMLCAPCHRKLHAGVLTLTKFNYFNEDLVRSYK
jgi:hypothetical protein